MNIGGCSEEQSALCLQGHCCFTHTHTHTHTHTPKGFPAAKWAQSKGRRIPLSVPGFCVLKATKMNRAGPRPQGSATRNSIRPWVFSKRLRGGGAARRSHWNGFSALGLEVWTRNQSSRRLSHCSTRDAGVRPLLTAASQPAPAPRSPSPAPPPY